MMQGKQEVISKVLNRHLVILSTECGHITIIIYAKSRLAPWRLSGVVIAATPIERITKCGLTFAAD